MKDLAPFGNWTRIHDKEENNNLFYVALLIQINDKNAVHIVWLDNDIEINPSQMRMESSTGIHLTNWLLRKMNVLWVAAWIGLSYWQNLLYIVIVSIGKIKLILINAALFIC